MYVPSSSSLYRRTDRSTFGQSFVPTQLPRTDGSPKATLPPSTKTRHGLASTPSSPGVILNAHAGARPTIFFLLSNRQHQRHHHHRSHAACARAAVPCAAVPCAAVHCAARSGSAPPGAQNPWLFVRSGGSESWRSPRTLTKHGMRATVHIF